MKTISQKTPTVKSATTNELITPHAGMIPLMSAISQSRLCSELIVNFQNMKERKRGFSVREKFLNFIAHTVVGACTLEDFESLRSDAALQAATGVRFMSPSSAGDFLRAFTAQGVGRLRFHNFNSMAHSFESRGITEATFDIDSSLHEVYKKCAEYCYEKHLAFNPMFLIEATNRICVDAKFRNGNASPQSDIYEMLARTIRRYHFLKRISVRIDSAGYQTKIFKLLSENARARFTVTCDQNVSVFETISTIPEWQNYRHEEKCEIGEAAGVIRDKRGTLVEYRMVAKRRPLERKPDEPENTLFNDGRYSYYVVATNFLPNEKDAHDIMHFHNQRGTAENTFKEMKYDFDTRHFPSHDFIPNAAYFMLKIASYNIMRQIAIAGTLLPSSWGKIFLRTIRFRFIQIAAKVVRSARGITVKVPVGFRYRSVFENALECCHGIFV